MQLITRWCWLKNPQAALIEIRKQASRYLKPSLINLSGLFLRELSQECLSLLINIHIRKYVRARRVSHSLQDVAEAVASIWGITFPRPLSLDFPVKLHFRSLCWQRMSVGFGRRPRNYGIVLDVDVTETVLRPRFVLDNGAPLFEVFRKTHFRSAGSSKKKKFREYVTVIDNFLLKY